MQARWLKPIAIGGGIAALVLTGGVLHAAPRLAPCAETEVTASIGGVAAGGKAMRDRISIVLVGDAGFNPTNAPVEAGGVRRKDRSLISFPETLAAVAPDIDGDLAFINLETVITDRNDLPPDSKGQTAPFSFRSHRLALKALTDIGFNLFSLANNHSMDYGARGLEETLYHMAMARAERAIAYAGIGANFEEATRSSCLELDGTRIAFAPTGIVTGQRLEHRAGPNKPGQVEYRNRPDFETVVDRLAAMEADYRILSIHYGLEGRVVPDERQLEQWRGFAAGQKGIDLILGHHPHVAQGVELAGDSLIFYGLGNFLHPGTAEMTRFGICRDYGLLAKVHLAKQDAGWRVGAIPLTKTYLQPERFAPQASATRIHALNHLAAQLDDGKSAKGVRFTPRADGSGLYCTKGAAALGGELGTLCTGWQTAAPPSKALAVKLAEACADKPFYGAGKKRAPSVSPFGGFAGIRGASSATRRR
jgi:hypothetical protein